ncbi:hypothetical protein BTM237_12950 [Helicobacter pylori]
MHQTPPKNENLKIKKRFEKSVKSVKRKKSNPPKKRVQKKALKKASKKPPKKRVPQRAKHQ